MSHLLPLARLVPLLFVHPASAQADERTLPVFADGQAQVVPGFSDKARWIRHDLWVVTEFDSDHDGELDRVHVDVTRPEQTESEGLKVPIVYETSPYYSGIGARSARALEPAPLGGGCGRSRPAGRPVGTAVGLP
jgi:X-Pro dipeptidyl-peptidase